MKITPLPLLSISALALATPLLSADEAKAEIAWVQPDEFRDIDREWNSSKRDQEIVLNQLEKMFTDVVQRRFPDDHTVSLRFTDVDLEGEFEPILRSAAHQEIRVVKDLYPARLEFSYTIKDANGTVVREGDERLRSSMMMAAVNSDRYPYPHTRQLLDDWARRLKITE
jgi:hypothetical protein